MSAKYKAEAIYDIHWNFYCKAFNPSSVLLHFSLKSIAAYVFAAMLPEILGKTHAVVTNALNE